MKKKISDLFCLMKCGLSFKSQVAFGILFLILGSVWEVYFCFAQLCSRHRC